MKAATVLEARQAYRARPKFDVYMTWWRATLSHGTLEEIREAHDEGTRVGWYDRTTDALLRRFPQACPP